MDGMAEGREEGSAGRAGGESPPRRPNNPPRKEGAKNREGADRDRDRWASFSALLRPEGKGGGCSYRDREAKVDKLQPSKRVWLIGYRLSGNFPN